MLIPWQQLGYQRSDGVFHVIDYLNIYGSNTHELCEEIKRRYPRSRITVYPDAAGAQRRSSANGMTDIIILQNAGFVVKAPRKHDPVRDRINATNARLCDANGTRNIFVSPNCKHLIDSLDKYTYKENTQIPDKDSGYDHMFDAFSYCIAYMWPIRRPTTVQQPQRWTAKLAV